MAQRSPRHPLPKRKQRNFVRVLPLVPALEALAHGLNALPNYGGRNQKTDSLRRRMEGPSDYEVWKAAEQIVRECKDLPSRSSLPPHVLSKFEELTEDAPVKLTLGSPFIAPRYPQWKENAYHVARLLWGTLLHADRVRLKQCDTCQRWYVDVTKNKKKRWCSESCKWKWWSRRRRYEADHEHQRKGTPRKKE